MMVFPCVSSDIPKYRGEGCFRVPDSGQTPPTLRRTFPLGDAVVNNGQRDLLNHKLILSKLQTDLADLILLVLFPL